MEVFRQGLRRVFVIGGGGMGYSRSAARIFYRRARTRPKIHLPRKFLFSSDFVPFIMRIHIEYLKRENVEKEKIAHRVPSPATPPS